MSSPEDIDWNSIHPAVNTMGDALNEPVRFEELDPVLQDGFRFAARKGFKDHGHSYDGAQSIERKAEYFYGESVFCAGVLGLTIEEYLVKYPDVMSGVLEAADKMAARPEEFLISHPEFKVVFNAVRRAFGEPLL